MAALEYILYSSKAGKEIQLKSKIWFKRFWCVFYLVSDKVISWLMWKSIIILIDRKQICVPWSFFVHIPRVLCAGLSVGMKSFLPQWGWIATPSNPPAAPSHREPAINIWKQSATRQTILCAHFTQKNRVRERMPHISNKAFNHFHVWPLAEIILVSPLTFPWGMPAILQGHLSKRSGPLPLRCVRLEELWQLETLEKKCLMPLQAELVHKTCTEMLGLWKMC